MKNGVHPFRCELTLHPSDVARRSSRIAGTHYRAYIAQVNTFTSISHDISGTGICGRTIAHQLLEICNVIGRHYISTVSSKRLEWSQRTHIVQDTPMPNKIVRPLRPSVARCTLADPFQHRPAHRRHIPLAKFLLLKVRDELDAPARHDIRNEYQPHLRLHVALVKRVW
jgi:hypothetical protein